MHGRAASLRTLRCYRAPSLRSGLQKKLPLIELRPVIRIRMRPPLAELGAQLFLRRGQLPPVVPRIGLLRRAEEWRELAGGDIGAEFDHFSQAAAEIVTAMRDV